MSNCGGQLLKILVSAFPNFFAGIPDIYDQNGIFWFLARFQNISGREW